MTAKAAPQFRQCHLKILRSLYDDVIAADDGSMHEGSTGSTPAAVVNEALHETPITHKTLDLIQQFINQRSNYHPVKARQTLWTQIATESQSRLDALLSISSEVNEKKKSAQKKRATPSRTPLLNMLKRPATPSSSMSSLLITGKKDIEAQEHEITSWTFINSMTQKRAKLCTSSCEDFRAQSFLGELYTECDVRVRSLHGRLAQLKSDSSSCPAYEPHSKRQRTEAGTHYFFRDYHSLDTSESDGLTTGNNDELVNEVQIKLCLWSNLLASVKEIVDEK
ncbi:hypothetical protein ACHAXN_004760 [Cyclotella atomus]|jgi:hypothetical protein